MQDNEPPKTPSISSSSPGVQSLFDPIQSPLSLHPEIDSLRAHLRWLQDALNRVETLEERLKLGRAYQEASYCLSRLLRTQHLLHRDADTEFDRVVQETISELLEEWGR